jgi:response regulator RpfG family c-di-GMP phosphodiesterase
MMPVMDGIEAFRRMKRLEGNSNINTPVVMLTANAVVDAKNQYMDEGFSDYIAKPVREEVLLACLKKFLPKEMIVPADIAAVSNRETEPSAEEPLQKQSTLPDYLDTATGLAYCMNDQNFYREMLVEYVNGDKTAELVEYFDKEDFEYYRITVHAVKSTSLTIGATKVSEDAKALEMACKEGNLDFVKQNHEAFLQEYKALIRVIQSGYSNLE